MLDYFYIAIGSAIGGCLRYWCSIFAASHFGNHFPYGTLIVNITGSLIIGFCCGLVATEKFAITPHMQKFIMVGICGGYTTFSSFSLETLKLMQNYQLAKAGANIILSVILCLVGVMIGYAVGIRVRP
jgi:CrcB protein